MKSLLQWVVSGLDELDQQASEADTASIRHVMASLDLYPSYRPLSVPGPGPSSPLLVPAKLVEEVQGAGWSEAVGLGGGLERQRSSEDSHSR